MNKRWHMYIAIVIGLCILFGIFGVRPYLKNSNAVDASIHEARIQLADFKRMLNELPSWLKARQELDLRREELNSRLYAKQSILELFEQLTIHATKNQLKVTEITPPISELLQLNNVIQTSDQPLFLNITIAIDGDYENFGRFVQYIENAPYFSGINNCLIIGAEQLTEPLHCRVGFKALLGHTGEDS